jgi:hypothetical protein
VHGHQPSATNIFTTSPITFIGQYDELQQSWRRNGITTYFVTYSSAVLGLQCTLETPSWWSSWTEISIRTAFAGSRKLGGEHVWTQSTSRIQDPRPGAPPKILARLRTISSPMLDLLCKSVELAKNVPPMVAFGNRRLYRTLQKSTSQGLLHV